MSLSSGVLGPLEYLDRRFKIELLVVKPLQGTKREKGTASVCQIMVVDGHIVMM